MSLSQMKREAAAAAKRLRLELAQEEGQGQGQGQQGGKQAAVAAGGAAVAAQAGAASRRQPRMTGVYLGCMENKVEAARAGRAVQPGCRRNPTAAHSAAPHARSRCRVDSSLSETHPASGGWQCCGTDGGPLLPGCALCEPALPSPTFPASRPRLHPPSMQVRPL